MANVEKYVSKYQILPTALVIVTLVMHIKIKASRDFFCFQSRVAIYRQALHDSMLSAG